MTPNLKAYQRRLQRMRRLGTILRRILGFSSLMAVTYPVVYLAVGALIVGCGR